MAKFRRKPVEVEAYQFKGDIEHGFPDGWLTAPHSILGDGKCTIKDEEGRTLIAKTGDWIVKDQFGDFCTVTKDYFDEWEKEEVSV